MPITYLHRAAQSNQKPSPSVGAVLATHMTDMQHADT